MVDIDGCGVVEGGGGIEFLQGPAKKFYAIDVARHFMMVVGKIFTGWKTPVD